MRDSDSRTIAIKVEFGRRRSDLVCRSKSGKMHTPLPLLQLNRGIPRPTKQREADAESVGWCDGELEEGDG